MKHIKKISLLVLSLVLTCVMLAGCGTLTPVEQEKQAQKELKAEDLASAEQYTINNFCSILEGTTADVLADYLAQGQILTTPTFDNDFLKRWQAFEAQHGTVTEAELVETTLTEDNQYVSRIRLAGSDGENMALVITYDDQIHPLKTVLEDYSDESTISFSQKMTSAAGNIVVGLLTVFLVLIILLLVISSFSLVNKATQKKPAPAAAPAPKAAQTAAPKAAPAAAAVPASDNNELLAVIAAAIAAAEADSSSAYAASPDGMANGYVVRSIRRLDTNKWR